MTSNLARFENTCSNSQILCEILIFSIAVLTNLEQISQFVLVVVIDFEYTFFLLGVFILGIASEFRF